MLLLSFCRMPLYYLQGIDGYGLYLYFDALRLVIMVLDHGIAVVSCYTNQPRIVTYAGSYKTDAYHNICRCERKERFGNHHFSMNP